MKLSNDQIKKIAEELDCGLICYIHRETKEIKSIIDLNDPYADPECWEEDIAEIENNIDQYVKIEKMPSRESFQIMEDFIDQVSNKRIRGRLIYALNGRKPFRNFKNVVDYNEGVRQDWFKFKAYKYQEWVKDELDRIAEDETDEPIQEIPMTMTYFDDDGNEYNPNLQTLPALCMSCKKRNDPSEEIVCNLTRMDQIEEKEFKCSAYEKI